MGLFSKKKEAEVKKELPPLKFPELPPEKPEKKEISPTEERIIKEAVAPAKAAPEMPMAPTEEEKPLFVKIDRYKEVMSTLNELRTKLKNATDILTELDKIKEDEERELASWHNDLESIKEKLMAIDRALFEV